MLLNVIRPQLCLVICKPTFLLQQVQATLNWQFSLHSFAGLVSLEQRVNYESRLGLCSEDQHFACSVVSDLGIPVSVQQVDVLQMLCLLVGLFARVLGW